MQYFFILGLNPELSIAEICAFFKREKISFKVVSYSRAALLLELTKEIDAEKILDQLGGTIKIGKILNTTKNVSPQLVLDQLTAPTLQSGSLRDLQLTAKISFGFSIYRLGANFGLPRNFGLEVKRLLKEKNISSRLVTSREPNLSSVTVAKNRLLKNGAEICFFPDQGKIYLGQTLAVQKFGEYSRLDYGRPGRDAFSGMLPPKVAKMMINLAQIPPPARLSAEAMAKEEGGVATVAESAGWRRRLTVAVGVGALPNLRQTPSYLPLGKVGENFILDPFCGSGTILQQAAILGYQNLIGSDVSEKAIEDTRSNIQYLHSSQSASGPAHGKADERIISHIPHTIYHIPRLLQLDVAHLSTKIKPKSIDAIITEPYLGPPQRGVEKPETTKITIRELSALYLQAFAEFAKVVKPDGKVVIIFPIIQNLPSVTFAQLQQIAKLGFKIDLNLPAPLNQILTDRGSLIYSREGQLVKREIFVFRKV